MKKFALLTVLLANLASAESWQLEKPSFWARDPGAASMAVSNGVCSIASRTDKKDWALSGIPAVAVKPLERYALVCEARGTSADASISAVTVDASGKTLNWSFASTRLPRGEAWAPVRRRLVVPFGVAKLEPRIVGYGLAQCEIRNMRLEKEGAQAILTEGSARLGEAAFRFGPQGFAMEVAGRATDFDHSWIVLSNAVTAGEAAFRLLALAEGLECTARFRWEGGELVVTLEGSGELTDRLEFPPAFRTAPGERLILPENEGMGYPVDEADLPLEGFTPYFGSGHGLCMPFFGCADDRTGRGWMSIVETQNDAFARVRRGTNGCWNVRSVWESQKGEFGYARKIRYAFFEQGGYVAIAKRYRRHAAAVGLLKTFAEKAKTRPVIDKLLGAANIWLMGGGDKTNIVADLQKHGIDRILWSGNGNAAELAAMNAMTNVLTSRYDIYSDVMDPAICPLIGHKTYGEWPVSTEAFPADILWNAPGQMQRAWGVERKDGKGMVYCVSLCDSKSYLYARRRIGRELKERPFHCRFIDTVTACAWSECWNPAHPMTRTDSRAFRVKLLGVVSDEFGLVCGSETGVDAVVPVCDYFEGMLSIGRFRVPDAGRHTVRIWTEVPADVAKFQLGERYRLPLWELVYHDCCAAHWYWGDYNNKLPALWPKRDLFNALYGTAPMYMFTAESWRVQSEAFAKSYRVAEPVSRLTALSEMTNHEILSPDRSVQRATFANGVRVTVNFGSAPAALPGSAPLAPMSSRIEP